MVDFEKLISVAEAARRLKMSESNVRYLLRAKPPKLRAFKLGPRMWRVDADSLEEYAERGANVKVQPELPGQ